MGARRIGISGLSVVLALVWTVLYTAIPASAEQLSLRRFGVSEGLPHSNVRCVFQDFKGYLWVGTADGLSRFDGYTFTNFDTSNGLGHSYINAVTEDRLHRIWIATNGGGVSCFVDSGVAQPSGNETSTEPKLKFVSFRIAGQNPSNNVNQFVFDADNRLWCATDGGLYRATVPTFVPTRLTFELVVPREPTAIDMGACADSRGRLWFGNGNLITEVVGGTAIIRYGPFPEFGSSVVSVIEDRGRLLALGPSAVFEFIEPGNQASPGTWKPIQLGLTGLGPFRKMIVDGHGTLWLASQHGLVRYRDNRHIVYTTANGLTDDDVQALYQDRDGDLWLGTFSGGLCMLLGDSARAYDRSDGLPDANLVRLFEDRQGHVYVSSLSGGVFEIADRTVLPIEWSTLGEFRNIGKRIQQDDDGNWWVGTDRGLYLYSGPDLQRARGRRMTAAEGAPKAVAVGDMYKDRAGRIWFGSADNRLFCIERAGPAGRLTIKSIPTSYHYPYRRLAADRAGDIWMGANVLISRLARGRDTFLQPEKGAPALEGDNKETWDRAQRKSPPSQGLPEVNPRTFWLDSRGWLWIGLRNDGVSVTRDPSASQVQFINYTTESGLASNTVWSITEDDSGRIYLGTGRGLDRLDPNTGHIRHLTAGDSFGGGAIADCMKDSRGNIWAATANSVFRLDPRADRFKDRAVPIYFSSIQAAGIPVPIASGGLVQGPALTLGPSRNDLLIEYAGIDFHGNHELKYQYKLEGADMDWSPPTEQRSVNYARLAPGTYTFLVRAVNQEGLFSPEPAIFHLRILPPFWRRWWFLSAAGALIAIAAFGAHRYRIARLVEMLQVRSRIASDLHDDIGANLTKIAILSEVANQQAGPTQVGTDGLLASIARISRESVTSMADIVWAIDPRRDTQQDLIRRMRQFAIEMLGAAGASVRIDVSGDDQAQRLGPDFRRQVFLIFKEAINNAARHSGCSLAEIDVRIERRGMLLRVQDNGTGFDINSNSDGNGLISMKRRAESLSGRFDVTTGNNGTAVTLFVPWTGQQRWRTRPGARAGKP